MAGRVLKAIDTAIRAAKFEGDGREVEYRIEGNPGLVLAVMPPNAEGESRKVWRFYYSGRSQAGTRIIRKVRLGIYGAHPPGMSLAKARIESLRVAEQVAERRDPVAEREAEDAEKARARLTFADLVFDYVADHRRQGHATTNDVERALLKDAVPALGHMRPADIKPLDIQTAIDAVRDRVEKAATEVARKKKSKVRAVKGEMARRVLRYIRQVFNHALLDSEELRIRYGLQINPADSVGRNRRGKVGRYGKAKARERFLSDDEIKAFWTILDESRTDRQTRLLLKLLLVTGARLSEVRCMDISELDLRSNEPVWHLPAVRAKNRVAHDKPLSPLAVDLLVQAIGKRKSGPVLPSGVSDDGFMTTRGARRAISRFLADGRLTCLPFTPHDFRRTVGTGMARLGVPDDIIGRALGHKKSDVTNAVYIKAGYEREKREAMLKWAQHLGHIVGLSTGVHEFNA